MWSYQDTATFNLEADEFLKLVASRALSHTTDNEEAARSAAVKREVAVLERLPESRDPHMWSTVRPFLGVLLLTTSTAVSSAIAQSSAYTSATVATGTPARLTYYATFKKDCSPGPLPEIRVLSPPKNGTLTVKRAQLTTGKAANCPTATAPAQVLFYQSRQGFVGEDLVVYEVRDPAGRVQSYSITITVREQVRPQVKPGTSI